jgi:phosphoribosylpyrophosphate synthetase
MRSEADVMDVEELQTAIDNAVKLAMTASFGGKDRTRANKVQGLNVFHRMMQPGGKDVVIAPTPSSSPLSKMITDSLAKVSGHPVIQAFEKHHFPELSSKIKTVERGYEDRATASRVTQTSPAEKKRTWEQQIKQLAQQAEAIEKMEDPSDADIDRLYAIHDEMTAVTDKLKNFKFEKKKTMHPLDRARGYYGYIQPTDAGKQLHEKNIIIVDDNIVTSETIAECIKSLLRKGIVPKTIVGFVMHKYS